jgi:hypothetical protein
MLARKAVGRGEMERVESGECRDMGHSWNVVDE